ncbi:hypothetical protein KGQ71_00715 [Patescibacteria group bacterium]|nr:hypothetical protein [Patescibacteria group bacterium]
MNAELRAQAISLRVNHHFSSAEIRTRIGVPKSTLSYWLKDYPLNLEEIAGIRKLAWRKGEVGREKYRKIQRQAKEREKQTIYLEEKKRLSPLSKESLYIAGLALYLAEGDKKNDTRLVLANTDIKVLKFFITWLQLFLDTYLHSFIKHLYVSSRVQVSVTKNHLGMGLVVYVY